MGILKRWRRRDPWLTLMNAYLYLGHEFASWASFQARGYFLPAQHEALNILEEAWKEVQG
jgi:hypothetical protein